MATKIADLSNDSAKDGLLKDVHIKKPKKKEPKKKVFGPYNEKRKFDD